MAIETKQINIVQVYEENVLDITQLKMMDIRNTIIELWDKQPIINQFPDLVAIIEPAQQLSCVVQNRRVTISNQDVTKDFNSRDLENYIRFVIKFSEIISKPLKAFGFNYSFLFNFPIENLLEIQNKNIGFINNPSKEDLIGGGVNFSYMKEGDRIQIVSTPIYGEDLKSMISLDIQVNVHFFRDTMPGFSDLITLFKKHHDQLKEQVGAIFNVS